MAASAELQSLGLGFRASLGIRAVHERGFKTEDLKVPRFEGLSCSQVGDSRACGLEKRLVPSCTSLAVVDEYHILQKPQELE